MHRTSDNYWFAVNWPQPRDPKRSGGVNPRVLILLAWLLSLIVVGVVVWRYERTPTPPEPPVLDISLPDKVVAHIGRIVTIEAMTKGKAVNWDVLAGPATPDLLQHDPHSIHFVTPTAGDYRLRGYTVVSGKVAWADTHVLVDIGPTPPVPPGPTPPPDPPKPPTPPDPAPIPIAGLRVLMVYESADLGKIPPAQRDIMYAKSVRDWLNSHCAKAANNQPEWDVLDKDVDMSNYPQLWQDAMKRARKSLPWLIISNGKTGYEGPLPANMDEAMKLFQKYAE